MAHFNELNAALSDRPAMKDVAALQKAVIATGRMVYEWRKAANLSQEGLGDAIGMKQESISRIERGLTQEGPKLATLAAIAKACGQRLIISGGPIEDVGFRDEADAETAWGLQVRRPKSEAPGSERQTQHAKEELSPWCRVVDVLLVGTEDGGARWDQDIRGHKTPITRTHIRSKLASDLDIRIVGAGGIGGSFVTKHTPEEWVRGAYIFDYECPAGRNPVLIMEFNSILGKIKSLLAKQPAIARKRHE